MDSSGSRIPSEALKKKRKPNDPQTMPLQIGMVTFIYYYTPLEMVSLYGFFKL